MTPADPAPVLRPPVLDTPSPAELIAALDALPGRDALMPVLDALPDARLVGGAVRDILAGRPSADLDLGTPSPPEDTMRRAVAAGLKAVPTGLAHGTVTIVSAGRPVEVTTLRRDVQTDGRHAVVAWTESWTEDAGRRDFTINAMSLGRDGVLHDPFGGVRDLRERRVRFVGEAARRIEEDALRILRFFRFHARFGGSVPDAEAVAAIATGAAGLDRLSAERVQAELFRLLRLPDPAGAVTLMHELGVLDRVLPGVGDPAPLARLVALGAPADPVLRLAALAGTESAAAARRLKLSNADAVRLAGLAEPGTLRPDAGDAELRRSLAGREPALLIDRTWLAQAGDRNGPADWAALRRQLADTPRPVFSVSGRDAVAAGIRAGPEVGRALAAVHDWWLSEGCRPDREDCVRKLEAFAAAMG
ncbi:CCA tRNA nucleotidyltransferase [Rhizosaccharibacter radicis]|uniref:CCA tRNA nucleotidyltransferase n=1 Tax=Rhizosaccharibacter radicis TaxID=2782605 RepID=A0ABT1VXF5_9PROT|nr:CCA tRNA nucleotidyltransferase [Acetobacteraceae bacterium KSS12]